MAQIIEMPRYGANMDEGTVATWFVAEGDTVKEGDPIAEIAIEKLSNELLAPADGVILKIVAEEGETLDCGEPIAYIGEEGESIEGAVSGDSNSEATPLNESAEGAAIPVEMPRYGANMDEGTVATWVASAGDQVDEGDVIAEIAIEKLTNELLAPASGSFYPLVEEGRTLACGEYIAKIGDGPLAGGEKTVEEDIINGTVIDNQSETRVASYAVETSATAGDLTPKAAKLAEELGVDASMLKGSGYFGKITREDVRNAMASGMLKAGSAPVAAAPISYSAEDSVRKMSQMEKVIAGGMLNSLSSTAQTTITMDMDVDNLVSYYEANKGRYKEKGVKLSYTSLLVQVIGQALRQHPIMRTVVNGAEFVEKGAVNIGIAVDIPGGLIVPNIKNAETKSLEAISNELASLAEKSKNNELTQEDLTGGSFTITNLGMFNIQYFTPVINAGESAILGLGAIRDEVVVKNGGIHFGKKMAFSLTHDHQVINGAPAARFLLEIQALINAL